MIRNIKREKNRMNQTQWQFLFVVISYACAMVIMWLSDNIMSISLQPQALRGVEWLTVHLTQEGGLLLIGHPD